MTGTNIRGKRCFTLDDQLRFAKISGDYNPIHVDPMIARRTLAGGAIVHGVQSILWALDILLQKVSSPRLVKSLSAVFHKPMVLEKNLMLSVQEEGDNTKITLSQTDNKCALIKLQWTDVDPIHQAHLYDKYPPKKSPIARTKKEVRDHTGTLSLFFPREAMASAFPALTKNLPPWQAAVMLASTRLVGMECPGLHSLYSELKFQFDSGLLESELRYQTTRLDERSQQITLEFSGPCTKGSILAFIRPKPVIQPKFSELKNLVQSEEFSRQKALVVGGSRGLGEIAAKILAAGGAQVHLTYFRGRDDALAVLEDIEKGGGSAMASAYDVLNPLETLSFQGDTDWHPTHLYYFATPFISSGSRVGLSQERFNTFLQYYVFGFSTVVTDLKSKGLGAVFYPSSVFIDELPADMIEYTLAKQAGESICRFLSKQKKMVTHYPRLPKMSTDQTVSVYGVNSPPPAPVILQEIRTFLTKGK